MILSNFSKFFQKQTDIFKRYKTYIYTDLTNLNGVQMSHTQSLQRSDES